MALAHSSLRRLQRTRSIAGTTRARYGRVAVVRATSAVGASQSQAGPVNPAAKTTTFHLACPICQTAQFEIHASPSPYKQLSCPRCERTFEPGGTSYLDLTLTSGVRQKVYRQPTTVGTDLFRQPLISFVYERGWRQNFAGAGFPGKDKEFEMAMRYLRPAVGGTLVDASCGTGLFTRLFARGGEFSGVVALDYSETMLQQAQGFFGEDKALGRPPSSPILCVRADIARLPFATGSVDAVHAGAAIHCWPNPQAAMAEISRVLRPGGVFVASTFLTALAPLGEVLGDDAVRPFSQALNPFDGSRGSMRYWEEGELLDLVASVGLAGYQRDRSRMFIMLSATKPGRA